MQHIAMGEVWTSEMWAFLDMHEKIQQIKKTIRISDHFSIVKFECLDQFW